MKMRVLWVLAVFALLFVSCSSCGPKPIEDRDGTAGFSWSPPPHAGMSVHHYLVRYWTDGGSTPREACVEEVFIGIIPDGEEMLIDSVQAAGVNQQGDVGAFSQSSERPVKVFR